MKPSPTRFQTKSPPDLKPGHRLHFSGAVCRTEPSIDICSGPERSVYACGRRRDTSKSFESPDDEKAEAADFMMKSAVNKLESFVGGQSVCRGHGDARTCKLSGAEVRVLESCPHSLSPGAGSDTRKNKRKKEKSVAKTSKKKGRSSILNTIMCSVALGRGLDIRCFGLSFLRTRNLNE